MKRAVLLGSVLSMTLLLSACGKESSFKSAINKDLSEEYSCLDVTAMQYYSPPYNGFDRKVFDEYAKNNTALFIKTKKNGTLEALDDNEKQEALQLDTLAQIGFFKKTQETQQGKNDWNGSPIPELSFEVDLYNLTDKGEKALKENPSAKTENLFCYAHRRVDSILNYTEENAEGRDLAEIKYSYKYTDLASWAKNDDVKAAFPEIEKTLNKEDKIGRTVLMKTNNGWQSSL